MGPGDRTQVARLGSEHLYPLRHLACLAAALFHQDLSLSPSCSQCVIWLLDLTTLWGTAFDSSANHREEAGLRTRGPSRRPEKEPHPTPSSRLNMLCFSDTSITGQGEGAFGSSALSGDLVTCYSQQSAACRWAAEKEAEEFL